MNKAILGWLSALIMMTATPQAQAFENRLEVTGIFNVGFSLNARNGIPLSLRLRWLDGLPFALEANVHVPYGVGAGLLLDVYRGEHLRVHAFDVGIFVPIAPQLRLTRPDIDRDFDLWTGLGIEWNYRRSETVAVDWRVFIADPSRVPYYYGAFCKPIYLDALKESQLWIGYVKRF